MMQFTGGSGDAQVIELVFAESKDKSTTTIKLSFNDAEFALGQIAHLLAQIRQDKTIAEQHEVASVSIRKLRAAPSESGMVLVSIELEKDIQQHFSLSVGQATELANQLHTSVDKARRTAPSSSTRQ
jgi:hypothetical protein